MPDGWRTASLDEIAAIRRRSVRVDDDAEYLRVTLRLRGQGMVRRDSVLGGSMRIKRQFAVRKDDLIVAEIDAKVGGMAVVPPALDGAIVSSHYFTLELDLDRVLPGWVSLLCESNHFTRQVRAVGSTNYAAVRPAQVLGYRLPLPPLVEQRRIVDLAQALDHTLAAAGTALQRLDDLMLSLIEERVFAQDYAWQTLGTLALPRGLAGGPFGSDLTTSNFVPEGVPVLQGSNLTGAAPYVSGPFKFVSPQKASTLTNNLAEPGDVVATQRGTLGQVALLPHDGYGSYVVSQSQMRLRADPERVSAEYAYLALSSRRLVSEVLRQKIATANPHINLGIFGRLSIPVPPLAAQAEIVDLVFGVLAQKEAMRAVAESTARLRSAITADLLSGNHEIPDSYDRFLDGAA
jgi:type I restriction enzyme S subunit